MKKTLINVLVFWKSLCYNLFASTNSVDMIAPGAHVSCFEKEVMFRHEVLYVVLLSGEKVTLPQETVCNSIAQRTQSRLYLPCSRPVWFSGKSFNRGDFFL